MCEFVNGCAADAAADRDDDLLPISVRRGMGYRAMRERPKTDESLPADSREYIGFRGTSFRAVDTVQDPHMVEGRRPAHDRDRIRTESVDDSSRDATSIAFMSSGDSPSGSLRGSVFLASSLMLSNQNANSALPDVDLATNGPAAIAITRLIPATIACREGRRIRAFYDGRMPY